jgi:ABC-2 type transport system ATP-binding protein
MDKLQVKNISKSFANHKALDAISLNIPENSVFGLLGPNGAGKTTLIRIINLITIPDGGEVLLNGKPLKEPDVLRIGYLPEERGLYKKMKVGEQALYLSRLKGLSKSDALKRLKYWFEKFEIESWWEKKVEDLSKGMQQKVQFIVTVIHQPELLIFDEPFSGFDPINVNIIKDEILNLRKNGATIVFSTHNMASVEEVCDHIALIDKAETILEGEVNEIKNRFKQHIFEVIIDKTGDVLEQDIKRLFRLESSEKQNIGHRLVVKMDSQYTSNDLASIILKRSNLMSFREILPNMNEIFIHMVEKQKITH